MSVDIFVLLAIYEKIRMDMIGTFLAGNERRITRIVCIVTLVHIT